MPTSGFSQDLLAEIFGQQPELALLGQIGRSGLGKRDQRLLRGRTSDFLNRFQQQVGSQLLGGNLNTQSPEDFFGGLNLRNELFNLSPQQRGVNQSQFSPRTRFFF
jgi:hypothetical protein